MLFGKKRLSGRLVCVLSLFWGFFFVGGLATAQEEPSRLSPVVLVGTILENPPYVLENPSAGIDLDIVRAVFARMGTAVDFIHAPISRVEFLLSQGRIDAMTTFRTRTDQCSNGDVFSHWHDGVSVRLSLAGQVTSLEDLAGLRVGMFPGAERVLASIIADHVPAFRSKVTIFRTSLVVRMLRYGRIDAYIGDFWALEHASRIEEQANEVDEGDLPFKTVLAFPPTPRQLCFRDNTLREIFNTGLRQLQSSGQLEEIQRHYRGQSGH